MFDDFFWNKIRNLIKIYHLNFLYNLLGPSYLSEAEQKQITEYFGKLDKDITPLLDKIFIFGKLSEKIGEENSVKLSYKDFNKYISDKEYKKHMSDVSKNVELDRLKKQAYLDILSKQFQVEKDTRQIVLNEENKNKTGIDLKKNLYKKIEEKFSDWSELQSSINYISESTFNKGRAEEILEKSEEDPFVYKVPLQDACPICKRLYLKSDNSPIIFRLSTLTANGTNIGKKVKDWKATIGPIHIHCRCILQYLPKNPYWSSAKQRYIEKEQENKVERKSKVKITIGTKTYEV